MSHDDEGLNTGTAERERLHRILGRLDDEDLARVDPPPALWGRISVALEAPEAGAGSASPEAGADAVGGPPATAVPVASLDERRTRRHRRLLIAAVAAALVLLGATGALLARGGSQPDEGQLVASATLEPLEPIGATADARLVSEDDHLQLVLDAHDMTAAPTGRHYELWLLGTIEGEPVDLGPMTGSTSVPVPDDVDIDEYDVVDISVQEVGQAEHSGHSLLRGTLT